MSKDKIWIENEQMAKDYKLDWTDYLWTFMAGMAFMGVPLPYVMLAIVIRPLMRWDLGILVTVAWWIALIWLTGYSYKKKDA